MSFDTIFKSFTGEAAVGVRCPSCFLDFAIPQSLHHAYRQLKSIDHLWCPSCGKTMIPSSKSDAEQLRDELAREKHRTEQARAEAEYQRARKEQEIRRRNAARGQVTRIKNRVKNGVCPACTRTFNDLARHMKSKHPHYCEPAPT